MSAPLRVAILGSTGSIGRQALQVAERFPELIEVVALAAGTRGSVMAEQARSCGVVHVAVCDPSAKPAADELPDGAHCVVGPEAIAALHAASGADLVLNALVGAAGLRASEATLRAGKRLALANKESLVVGGELLMPLAGGSARTVSDTTLLIPVDSEHSALFQCLLGEPAADLETLWLTASGGPFRGCDRARLASVTPAEALAHPRWTMGPKITIDSATLMNKGLEAIEAHHLFGVGYDDIRIIVHPQSVVHSMTRYRDGSVKAHLGATDMRVPIQYAFSFPRRWDAPVPPVDLIELGHLDFEQPDPSTFRCLGLALDAGKAGGTLPAAMNAANEVAVAAFLEGSAGFTDIDRLVERVMDAHRCEPVTDFDQLERVDAWARAAATELLQAS